MPRMEIQLEAAKDFEFEADRVNHTVKGRFDNALKGTEYGELHDENRSSGYCFLGPYNGSDVLQEGDGAKITVASPWRELLGIVRDNLRDNPVLEVGQMQYRIKGGREVTNADKPSVGDEAVLETKTGTLISVPDDSHDEPTWWRPQDGVAELRRQIHRNIWYKAHSFGLEEDHTVKPVTDIHVTKTFSHRFNVTAEQSLLGVFHKMRIGVDIESELHKEYVDLLLNLGVGMKNAYGFGFLYYLPWKTVDRSRIDSESRERADTHA